MKIATGVRVLCVGLGLLYGGPVRAASTARPDSARVRQHFERNGRSRLVPMLQEVLRFATVAGNDKAETDQRDWLRRCAETLGLTFRDAGTMSEIELPGPKGSPVLGLVIHGDVQPVDESAWSAPPFEGLVRDGAVWGRGAADDKGPLVQTLLALHALRESGPARTHTIRLLVGTNEESSSTDITDYLKTHEAPDYSLVLDALFPVVVGEKAWNALRLTADPEPSRDQAPLPWRVVEIEAGLAASIVPDRAWLKLRWADGQPEWTPLVARLRARTPPTGTTATVAPEGADLVVEVKGRSAHAGMNIAGGRNALVALAEVLGDDLPRDGRGDLLRFTREAARDLRGGGLELPAPDALWGGYDVNAALLKTVEGRPMLTINIRRPPPWTGPQLATHLAGVVERFNVRNGSRLRVDEAFYYADEPLVVDPESPLVKRLLASYRRVTGDDKAPPAVMGGGTYAKRLPRSTAFGLWFPGKPYTGHDSDEHIPIDDLERGTHVLIDALVDIACGEPLAREEAIRRK